MNDPMTILKADHREAKALLAKLVDSEEGAEREKAVAELTAALSLHMQLEEELVYPLVESEVAPGSTTTRRSAKRRRSSSSTHR